MWRPSTVGPNASMLSIGVARARHRDLVRNDPWASAAVDRSVSNGIGTGVQAKCLYGDDAFKAADKRAWKHFCKYIDADGALDFSGLQALAWREWREAGEVFARLRSRRLTDGLPIPMQVQLIESEQCPHDYNATAPNGNPIKCGIEFNAIGRRVAYWMYGEHPGEWSHSRAVNASMLRRIPADQIVHLYRPKRAGQHRGTPDGIAAMVQLWNAGKMHDAVLERHKLGNMFAMFYVRKNGATGTDDSMLPEMQTDTDTDSVPLAGLEPGTAQELPDGVEPVFSTPPDTGSNYAEFYRMHLSAAAAAYGIPVELLTGDLRNISDRALRLILNEFRRLIEMDQWVYFIPQFCQVIREAYFDAAVLAGVLTVPDYATAREDVVETLWVPQGWPYSHPVQDVKADKEAILAGLQSRTATILSNGDDPEQVDAEIAADNARAAALGLAFDTDVRTAQPMTQPTDPALLDQNQ